MDIQHIIDILLATIMAIVGFFARQVHSDVNENSKDLSHFKTHVAENYARNDRIEEVKDAVANANARLDAIYELLTKGVHK